MKSQPGLISYIASFLLVIWLSNIAAPVCAQAVALTHDGKEGVWLPLDIAKKAQQDSEELIVVKKQITLLNEQLTIRMERLTLTKEALAISEKETKVAKSTLEEAERVQRESEEALDGWFAGKPILWLLIGVVAGGVTAALIGGSK